MSDSVERWRRTLAILDGALQRDPAERRAFLDATCADAAERAEVEALLVGAAAPGFLESPAVVFAAPLLAARGERTSTQGLTDADAVDRLLDEIAGRQRAPTRSTPDVRARMQAAMGGVYRLGRELPGGMSCVFEAEEVALGRRVVVKVLPPGPAAAVSAERFRREIQFAARLRHRHLVPLLTASEADGLLYYTMPYIDGESLRARLSREGRLTVPDAVLLLREVTDALAYAHRQGVVHRDLKPANILLEEGHAIVTDFGVAKALNDATQGDATASDAGEITAPHVVLGTPVYMAPEQITRGALDHRADLYALGVVAYEVLSGQPPFTQRSVGDVLAAHVRTAPTPVGEHCPDLPAPLAALVMRLLEKRPEDRPQSAEDVLRELERLDGSTTSAGTGAVHRAKSAPWRRPLAMVLGSSAWPPAPPASGGCFPVYTAARSKPYRHFPTGSNRPRMVRRHRGGCCHDDGICPRRHAAASLAGRQ